MKTRVKYWLISILSAVFLAAVICAVTPVIAASADTGSLTCTTASGNYLSDDYISAYKIPTSMMTYEANGGGNIAKAFDGDWNSFWQTATENNGQQNENPTFLNAITVTFSQAVTIESIMYASSSEREGHGYPITLNIYTDKDGELSLYGSCNSNPTNNRVVFTFNEAVTVTQVKFEFRKVNTWHNWTATAKEICFLRPDDPEVNKALDKVLDLFDDYAQLSVKSQYKTQLSELRNDVSGLISYESALKPLLDRAEAIIDGHLHKDSRREFSTDPNAVNVINQYGDMRSYAYNTLKLDKYGINRQVTGIAGLANQTITIYVDGNEGDPLPSVAFTQVKNDWRGWATTHQLSLGKNVFTFPNLVTDNYSSSVIAGGPIHIINPYVPSQQSSGVKVYIEGGYHYPVFFKGSDVQSFLNDLKTYCDELQNNADEMSDVAELVGDHFLHTVSAKRAYNDFVTRKIDPQTNSEKWDNYLRAFMEFDGISFTPGTEYYDERNAHLYHNFRVAQPWGGAGAYSTGDYIGFISFGEDSMTNLVDPGWGVAHEIGHALDVSGRIFSETTNNMWAKFEQIYLHNNPSTRNSDLARDLGPDEKQYSPSYFRSNTYNFQIWWTLETVHHGFWGKLDNLYRYYDESAALTAAGVTSADSKMTQTERMVYFSSLAVGEDLGYFYDRYGFSFTEEPFKLSTASAAYNKLVEKALEDEKIIERGYKYWYIDANQYYYDYSGNDYYDSSSQVEIAGANKTDAGYVLYLTIPEGTKSHLGYEIMEYRGGKWSVIGFTYTSGFTDTTEYADGYVPQYKIRAYDREMSTSAESTPKTYTELRQSDVCRIGEVYYSSLSEAVAAANANDTIYICANMYDGVITVDKNLTLLPDPSLTQSVIINKSLGGVLITVPGGVTLTIGNNDGATIIFDGNRFSQNGALIRVNGGGKLYVGNVEFRNNINTDHAGAVFVNGNGAVAEFTNVTFKNNSVTGYDRNGGAIANFNGIITLTDCTIIGNSTNTNGGALTLDGKATLIRCIIKDNAAGDKGGAMFIACNANDRTVTVDGGEISGNTAKVSGSAIYLGRGIFTIVGGDSAVKISGEIFRGEVAVRIEKALPDLSGVTFKGSFSTEEKALLTAVGDLTFTETDLKSLNTGLATAVLSGDNKTVMVKLLTATVTISVNGTEIRQEVALGDFGLPETVEGIAEDKYLSAWVSNGKLYATGETVTINGDCTFTAEIKSKCTVTLKYVDGSEETHYIIPNTHFYLPADSKSEQYSLLGWNTNGGDWYAPFAGVTITKDTVFEADMVKRYTVTIDDKGEQTVNWYNFADAIILEECSAPEGKKFSHWLVNGVVHNAGDTVSVTEDMLLTAVFEEVGTENPPSDGVNVGAIIITVVLIIVVAGLAVAVVFVVKKRKGASYDYDEDDYENNDYDDNNYDNNNHDE